MSKDEVRQLHEAIHDLEDPGFLDIVKQGHNEFDKPSGENEGENER